MNSAGDEVMALGVAVQPLAAPGQFAAFVARDLDVALVLRHLVLVDDGADHRAVLQRMVDLQLLHAVHHALDEGVMDLATGR